MPQHAEQMKVIARRGKMKRAVNADFRGRE